MNKKQFRGWLKHADFIILDILVLQLCFVFAYWIVRGYGNPYAENAYQFQAIVLFASQTTVVLFSDNYSGVLRRKKFDEGMAVIKYMLEIIVVALAYLFMTHQTDTVSRLQFGVTSVLFIILGFIARYLLKIIIIGTNSVKNNKRSIVLITSESLVDEALGKLLSENDYHDYFISGILLLDSEEERVDARYHIPVKPLSDESIADLAHGWVDEVFILQPDLAPLPANLINSLMEMGMTINFSNSALSDDRMPITEMRELGGYKVLSNGLRFFSAGHMAVKRAVDIIGSLIGCVLTGIIFVIIAPIIYKKSPGPIFFVQTRIGQNGRTFQMYKFRSMYMDAEERKAELMEKNNIKDGMMFKMDDDPRIIGSEKKDRKGRPRGIGNFIRNTSLDEFPQFFNVLKGDMSIVGWRPATLDEWEKYNFSQRIRAGMKPGVTGMWQVSGRSEITDFDEVVKLDREYIETWSLALDLKIILKTIVVVVTGKGAK